MFDNFCCSCLFLPTTSVLGVELGVTPFRTDTEHTLLHLITFQAYQSLECYEITITDFVSTRSRNKISLEVPDPNWYFLLSL